MTSTAMELILPKFRSDTNFRTDLSLAFDTSRLTRTSSVEYYSKRLPMSLFSHSLRGVSLANRHNRDSPCWGPMRREISNVALSPRSTRLLHRASLSLDGLAPFHFSPLQAGVRIDRQAFGYQRRATLHYCNLLICPFHISKSLSSLSTPFAPVLRRPPPFVLTIPFSTSSSPLSSSPSSVLFRSESEAPSTARYLINNPSKSASRQL